MRDPRAFGSYQAAQVCPAVPRLQDCRRKGSKRVLKYFQDLAPEGVEIQEQMCFDECGMGPNIQLQPSGNVVNGVSSKQAAADLLAAHCRDSEAVMKKLVELQSQDS
mmetsp:Transcript_15991/g.44616  ORF Transcript_15991/g.44616 Transcript_15991/m.44616 type:complete len:107 (-) Transcript_15991:102-422(-)